MNDSEPLDIGPEDYQRLLECEEKIGYRFTNRRFLLEALTHSSVKTVDCPSNERLEFLGDSVLGLVVTEFLYNFLEDRSEGDLTQIKSVVVSTATLAEESDRLALQRCYFVGKGVTRKKKLPPSLLANVFEAIVAAIYRDGGFEEARRFVLRNLFHQVLAVCDNRHRHNYKSLLQHYAQRVLNVTPTYRVVGERGPDHLKSFEVAAVLGKERFGIGRGTSKKEAEQVAARQTLRMLAEQGADLNIENHLLESREETERSEANRDN